MAVEDVAKAVIALSEGGPEVREKVRAGDVGVLGELVFTDEERDLVIGAAEDDPEVSGFDVKSSKGYVAIQYVSAKQDRLSPEIRSNFSAQIAKQYGGDRAVPCRTCSERG